MNKWAVKTGNWSDTDTWNDWIIPTIGDDVYANWYTVSIDLETIEVDKISTAKCPDTNIEWWNFQATVFHENKTYICDIEAGASICLDYWLGIWNNNAQLTVIGNIYWWYNTDCYWIYLSANSYAITKTQSPIIYGNIYGWTGNDANWVSCRGNRSYRYNITGDVYSWVWWYGVYVYGATGVVLEMVGNVYAHTKTAIYISWGIIITSMITGVINWTSSPWVLAVAYVWTLIVSWWIINRSSIPAITFNSNTQIYFTSWECFWTFNEYNQEWEYIPKTLVSLDGMWFPLEKDVRKWLKYWPIKEYEWTCNIPPADSVYKNVPVDDTVWTADFQLEEMLNKISKLDIGGGGGWTSIFFDEEKLAKKVWEVKTKEINKKGTIGGLIQEEINFNEIFSEIHKTTGQILETYNILVKEINTNTNFVLKKEIEKIEIPKIDYDYIQKITKMDDKKIGEIFNYSLENYSNKDSYKTDNTKIIEDVQKAVLYISDLNQKLVSIYNKIDWINRQDLEDGVIRVDVRGLVNQINENNEDNKEKIGTMEEKVSKDLTSIKKGILGLSSKLDK